MLPVPIAIGPDTIEHSNIDRRLAGTPIPITHYGHKLNFG